MAAPRTWVTAELVTATIMNGHVRDPLNSLAGAKAIVLGMGDSAASPLVAGLIVYVSIPFGIRLNGWTLLADAVGSIVLDLWKDAYASFPPTVADTITAAAKPTLTAQQNNRATSIPTWITDLQAGDVLALKVDSATTVRQVTLTLQGTLLALV